MIDVHVHLRDWNQKEKETLKHGFSVAQKAYFTALFEMPNTDPPLTDVPLLKKRIKEAKEVSDGLFYGVYGGITADYNQLKEIVEFAKSEEAVVGLKLFAGHSTGNMGLTEEDEQLTIYKNLKKLNYRGVLAVHCEKESLLNKSEKTHSLRRGPVAEIESVRDQIRFLKESGFEGHLHICHISTLKAIDLVNEAKKENLRISCGATAHHALLNETVANEEDNLLRMNPPLRSKEDQNGVFSALLDGRVDWIESDHAPHTKEDKLKGYSGIVGFAGTLLLIKALREAKINKQRLIELLGENQNRVFGKNIEIRVPSDSQIDAILPEIRDSYWYDPFISLR